ncbi:MAG TPA: hypothetical protein VGB73_00190 [Pyrinomonadaceae bacterium]|jgi:hypothetical protein
MPLDLYHQILLKLHETTGGNDKVVVNLVDLIKKEGYGGAVDDIYEFMSREGWIANAPGEGKVRITNWGIDEVRRSGDASPTGDTDALQQAAREARRAAEQAREFADLFEQYAASLAKPGGQEKARKLRLSALDKLREVQESVAAEDKRTTGRS